MTPRQIIAQFKATLNAVAADMALGRIEREQQMAGALALANRLIRFHPQLTAKGATRSFGSELKALLAAYSSPEEHVAGDAIVTCPLPGHRRTA